MTLDSDTGERSEIRLIRHDGSDQEGRSMILDQFVHQLPDTDPDETAEWLDSLDAVIDAKGTTRARYLMSKLTERARQRQVGTPAEVSTPYVNTIPTDEQPWFPGDEYIEKRIRAFIRWNAAVMVVYANKQADGIGGHLSTFASSAAQYEVGFNHFFRGKDDGLPGDHVYFQGHAVPGIYARAFVEGRLDEEHLDNFRRELSGNGLSSYPHPWLMPEFWEFPTVSMGLGPINSIYHARFNKYLQNRRLDDTSQSRVWCFLGDGECDEPETLGSISLAGREQLDNLVWVINCNLQRLDGPVRGNGKVIQELEAFFRGANWNVIKVIWGSAWDELLARDTEGVLLHKMNSTVDGDFQRYAVGDGAHIREHFFGPDPRLRKMVEHLSDEELRALPRGGHDYKKLYAAYKAATEQQGAPTVILAKTVKGWALGSDVEGRNATHQIKKMTIDQLKTLRERLYMQDEVPDSAFEDDRPPYFRPAEDSREFQYLMDRRRALDGALPRRVTRVRQPLTLPPASVFDELKAGSKGQAVSTTMAFTRLLRTLARAAGFGERVVPIIPDEARTFGMDSLFRELKIYSPSGQLYEPVDAELLLSYAEGKDGQLLEEGITEAGSMASFTAAGTAYATRGIPMVPFFIFYSMFGFQRVGDLIWAAADARARGFLLGATAGRTTLLGEGLQHQDGHSHVLASTVPTCQAYDPAFAYEMAAIVERGLARMYGGAGRAGAEGDELGESVFYYLTLYNENYEMPAMPTDVDVDQVCDGLYSFEPAPDGDGPEVTLLFSGTAHLAAREARDALLEHHGVRASLWSATSYKALREEALSVERWNRLHPLDEPRVPLVTRLLAQSAGPIVAVTDFIKAVPDQIVPFLPEGRSFVSLGTDGFGRSDTREALRRFFETDGAHVQVAVLSALARDGLVDRSVVADCIKRNEIEADAPDPRTR
jgi:pyruvate dehydrogenase E1 component